MAENIKMEDSSRNKWTVAPDERGCTFTMVSAATDRFYFGQADGEGNITKIAERREVDSYGFGTEQVSMKIPDLHTQALFQTEVFPKAKEELDIPDISAISVRNDLVGAAFVSESGKSLVAVSLPNTDLRSTKPFERFYVPSTDVEKTSERYTAVFFKSDDTVSLSRHMQQEAEKPVGADGRTVSVGQLRNEYAERKQTYMRLNPKVRHDLGEQKQEKEHAAQRGDNAL